MEAFLACFDGFSQSNCPAMMKRFSGLKIAIKTKSWDAADFNLERSQICSRFNHRHENIYHALLN